MDKKRKELEVKRKEINRRVKVLNENIGKLIKYARSYCKSVDPLSELNFEPVSITELRCESCSSEDIEDKVWDDEDDPHKQDIGFQCNECDHFTLTRTEEN